MSQVICVRRVNPLLQCTVKKQRKRESRRQKLLQCTLGKRTRESRQQNESHGMVHPLNSIRQVRQRTRAKEGSLIPKAPPSCLTNERQRHGTKSAQEKKPQQLAPPTLARMGRDDDHDDETSRKRSRMRASVPKYKSRFWTLSQLLQTSDSLWDDHHVPPPPSSEEGPYNVHVMERTLSLKLVAGFHKEALEFCHDVLICWYEQAALVEWCQQQQQRQQHNDPSNLQHVRNGIAYMWYLYSQVASRVLNDDTSGPSSRRTKLLLLQQLLDVPATSCPLVRNHSAVVLQRVKLGTRNQKWIGNIHCETIQGFSQAVQPHVSKREESIVQLLSWGIATCNNAVRTLDGSLPVTSLHRTTNEKLRWNGTLGRTLLKSISALERTVATFRTKWPPSYRMIDRASAVLLCKEANRLSRIKEAILNLEDDCSVSETAYYTEDSDGAESSDGLQDNSCVTGFRSSKCWGVDYACRCFARFATQQELEGHTCHEGAPESQGHDDDDPNEWKLLPNIQVGSRIAVYWACDDQYFEATVTRQNFAMKKPLYLEYDDGDCEWVDLREKTFRLLHGSCSMEDGPLVEYGCKHCPFSVYETKEKLLEHESVCHAGLD